MLYTVSYRIIYPFETVHSTNIYCFVPHVDIYTHTCTLSLNAIGDERTTDGWSEALYVWLERLEDGSLRRYSVDHWPEWRGN